jgi:hypothetical protein
MGLRTVADDIHGPRFGQPGRRAIQPQIPLSSSAKADDPVFETLTSDREAAAYWIARLRGR